MKTLNSITKWPPLEKLDSKWTGDFIVHFCPTCPEGFVAPDYFKSKQQ
jgi:hypothetical protein